MTILKSAVAPRSTNGHENLANSYDAKASKSFIKCPGKHTQKWNVTSDDKFDTPV
jgi:hypothetical protein